ncbi:hypothetical protein [Fuerstiella marisgermanici]|uniref:Putative methyltransferase (Contains TPR repeat) n=1 Tax=Fuerstiella marisgermanici TaxID=1891926 RepID=A0A1P8WQP9_9PLAN|nr:hypothetical protein [Fuerstiella marisgermanici]APZ96386.1 putative methyltransferase (contains TPR repeat) [Fuerstiella marisgermanici]
MIRCIWTFKLSPSAFLMGVPRFCVRYLRSRNRNRLLCGIPAMALTATIIMILRQTDTDESRADLKARYARLSQAAIESNAPEAAETYFARVLTLSDDRLAESFNFAKQLYLAADGPANHTFLLSPADESLDTNATEELLRRSLRLMQSLAPRRGSSKGYIPAHQFLAGFWRSRLPKTDLTTTLALQHEAAAAPHDPEPAIRLARFISERGYHQHALDLLEPLQKGHAGIHIQLAVEHAQLQHPRKAEKCLANAESILVKELLEDPTDVVARLALSRVQAAQGRLLESMLLLADGCQHERSPKLVDHLISRYSLWLSMMAPEAVAQQLNEITLALKHSTIWDAAYLNPGSQALHTSTGEAVFVPGPIVAFHAALLAGDGEWLVPLILGTDAAARADFVAARDLLQEAYEVAPRHPVIANNLAWTLLQMNNSESDSGELPNAGDDSTQHTDIPGASLLEAWELTNIAVAADPENLPFRETRGQIAAATNRWQIALEDLQTCADAGFHSRGLFRTLNLARQRTSQ